MSGIVRVQEGATAEYEEKKSRFIARVYRVDSEEEAVAYIEAARKQFWDARHNCYAFVIGDNNEISRCNDDGEPSQTAGKPILEVITNQQIHNCLVIVTRYFGGTLLGTGGLVRAYTKSTKDALMESKLVEIIDGSRYRITTDYTGIGKIQFLATELGYVIVDTEYTDKVDIIIDVEIANAELMVKKITDNTNGRAYISKIHDLPIEKPYTF